jgi:hypothetical protein
MKPLTLVGIVLVVLGIAGLVFGHISYTSRKKVLDVGPVQATAEEEHTLPIPDIAAIVAVIAGVGLLLAGRRRA